MKNMRESKEHHEEYTDKNMEMIKSKQSFLREELDQIMHLNENLKSHKLSTVTLLSMKNLLQGILKKEKNGEMGNIDYGVVEKIKKEVNQSIFEFGHYKKNFEDVENFIKKSDSVEISIKVMLVSKFYKIYILTK